MQALGTYLTLLATAITDELYPSLVWVYLGALKGLIRIYCWQHLGSSFWVVVVIEIR